MSTYASATLHDASSGSTVFLLGVAHNSALYGKLAHELIHRVRPDAVVLEVDEERLREQASRGHQWLVQQDRQGIVQRTLQPFLAQGSIWDALTRAERSRSAHRLANEGAALLEGGVYGGEVIMACHAATQCGADIVLGDRAKAISSARLLAARHEQRLARLRTIPDDDWSLLTTAAGMAAARLLQRLESVFAPLAATDAQAFAEQLHPIFLVAEVPAHALVLQRLGCDAGKLVASLKRLVQHGCHTESKIEPADIATVQDGIERIERHKHSMRSEALGASTLAATRDDSEHQRRPANAQQAQCHHSRTSENLSRELGWPIHHKAVMDAVSSAGDVFSRWCTRGVGHMYSFDVRDHLRPGVAALDELSPAASSPAGGAATPYFRTTVHERDCILAHRIQAVAGESGPKTVVAVVGANHLPGILHRWSHGQPSAVAQAECTRFLAAPAAARPDEGPAQDVWKLHAIESMSGCMEAGALAAAAYAPYRLMRGLPALWRWVPVAAVGAAVCASLSCTSDRQRRMAQLVSNLAAHHDALDRRQSAV